MNASSFLRRQQRTETKRDSRSSSSSSPSIASTSSSTSSLLSACPLLASKTKRQHLQIIIEDSEDLSDSPRPSFSSGRSTPDKRRPKINEIRLAKQRSEEDLLSNESMLAAPRPAPRPPSPVASSSIHLAPRTASPAPFTRSTSPLPQSVTTRSTTPSPIASPDARHLSFQFPLPPHSVLSGRNRASPSPFSSPSSVSSGLPVTPDQSPLPSPRFSTHIRSDSSSTASQLTRLRSIKPLTIVKKNELSFDTFFSSPISPSTSSDYSEGKDDEPLSLEPISFALPKSPTVTKASCDPFVVVPSPRVCSPEPVEQDSDEELEGEEFYSSELSSMLTLRSAMPQQHDLSRARPESLAPPPRHRLRMSKPLPDIPVSPSPISATDEAGSRKGCFPSAQLDPAWGRRSFLIPSRPPPPPPACPVPPLPSTSSAPVKKTRPPSLELTKPLPRSSVVPSDEVDGSSIFSFYGVSPFVDSDYLSTGHSDSSCSLSGSSSGPSEASSLPTSPSSEGFDHDEVVFDGQEVELDAFELQFGVDPLRGLDHFDMESDLMLPVSLPGSPVPFTPVEADLDDEARDEDDESRRVLRSRWSSSTLGSVQIKSPQTTNSAVSKFKMYFRGNQGGSTAPSASSPRTRAKKRSMVVVGPSSSTLDFTTRRRSGSSALFSVPRTPKSPKSPGTSRSTISSFSFDTPLSPTFSLPTSASPTKLSPAALRRLGAEAALSTTSPAALRRLGVGVDEKKPGLSRRTSSSSVASAKSSVSEKKRKPIPIEMFLRA